MPNRRKVINWKNTDIEIPPKGNGDKRKKERKKISYKIKQRKKDRGGKKINRGPVTAKMINIV